MKTCATCKHAVKLDQNSPRANVWYNWLCGRYEYAKSNDPVSGAPCYLDFHGYTTDMPHPYCRNIRRGSHCDYHNSGSKLTLDIIFRK